MCSPSCNLRMYKSSSLCLFPLRRRRSPLSTLQHMYAEPNMGAEVPLPTHVEHITGVQVFAPTMKHKPIMDAQVLLPTMPHITNVEPSMHHGRVHVQGPLLVMDMRAHALHHMDTFVQGTNLILPHGDLQQRNYAIKALAKSGYFKLAFHIFEQLQQEGIMPEKATFTGIIFACASRGGLTEGKRMHARICCSEYGGDQVVCTALLSMYGKQGNIEHAAGIFDEFKSRDVVAWSAMITANTQQGKSQRALQLHYQMLEECVIADTIAVVCILDACIDMSEKERLWMYVHTVSQHDDDVVVGTALLNMCGKCGDLYTATAIFNEMIVRNVQTWSAMIAVLVRQAQCINALQLCDEMKEQGVLPNDITFISIVSACVLGDNIHAGKRLHACIVGSGVDISLPLGNSLLNLYGKCGKFDDAVRLFEALPRLDMVTFTTIITASIQHGKSEELYGYVNRMISTKLVPDAVMLISILEACCGPPGAFTVCSHVHSFIIECGYDSDIALSNALLNAYYKLSSVREVHWIFNQMSARDAISWNAVICMHAQQEEMQDVLRLFQQMQQETMVDKVTFLHTMSAFTYHAALAHGIHMHTHVLANQLQSEITVSTALIDMYGRCGSLKLAKTVFNEQKNRDLVLWNTMVKVYAHSRQSNEVKQLLGRLLLECFMPDKVCYISVVSAFSDPEAALEGKRIHACLWISPFVSDIAVNNALINMYGKCCSLTEAKKLFNRMCEWDSISWNILLSLCNLHGHTEEVKYVSDKMVWEGHVPDKVTWTNCLAACADSINLVEGKRVHAQLHYNRLDEDNVVSTALLSMYSKCGELGFARSMFDRLPSQTLVSWNSMLAAYAQHGLGKEALEHFDLLCEKLSPDRATFGSVLTACSHAGLLHEGSRIFIAMLNHGFAPSADDFSCIVHLLGRVGSLDKAENFINAVQLADALPQSYLALLSTCRYQRDVERGERAARRILQLDSKNAAAYVLLSNLFAEDAGIDASLAKVAEG